MHHPQKHYRKIIILILCFILTSVFVYRAPSSKAVPKQLPLTQALSDIKGRTKGEPVPLDPRKEGDPACSGINHPSTICQTCGAGRNT